MQGLGVTRRAVEGQEKGHNRAQQSDYHLQQEEVLQRELRAVEAQVQHRDSPDLVLASWIWHTTEREA